MPSPIVVSGATPFYGLNTRDGEFDVNVPPIDMPSFRLTMFTVADLGGLASPGTPITVNFVGGAVLNDGTTSIQIKKPYGSVSFGQIDTNTYIIPLPVIRGNTEPGRPSILVSTPHTVISTVRTISTMDVLHNMAMRYAMFSTKVFAPRGFQPSVEDPYSGYDYVSAITTRTGYQEVSSMYISTVFIQTLRTSSLSVDANFNTSYFENGNISTKSTLVRRIQFPNPKDTLFMSSGQLYLGSNQITQDMQKLVPEFYSSLIGIMITNDNPSPGISSLSTQVSLAPFTFNANPGLSTLNEVIIPRYRAILSESNMSSFNDYFGKLASTTRCDTGLSSLRDEVALQFGLSLFNISSFSTLVSKSLSSINEGKTVSTLFSTLVLGLSSINQPGIFLFKPFIQGYLSSTECSVKVSTLSTLITQGNININISSLISSFSNDVFSGFDRTGSGLGISTLSTTLGRGLINVNNSAGASSFYSAMTIGFSNVNIGRFVSSLSTTISHGLSTLYPLSLGISSLAGLTSLISTNIFESGISSLLLEFQTGVSTLSLNPGLSSLVIQFNKAWSDISIAASLSSLSTTFGFGIQDTRALISSHIPLSTLFTSTILLQSNNTVPRLYGNLLVENGRLFINNSTPQIDASSSARPSTLLTSNLSVTLNANFKGSLTTSNLDTQFLTASSINVGNNVNTCSTITNILTFIDRSNGNPYSLTFSNANLFWKNVSVFDTADPGASTLSSIVGPRLSSIADFSLYSRILSTTFSSIGESISGLSSLSSLYGTSLKQTNIRVGLSTATMVLDSLLVSSLVTSLLVVSSVYATTTNTSSIYATDVQPLDPNNSFLRCSTLSTGSDSVINNLFVNVLSTNNLNVNNITWANVNRIENLVPVEMAFSTVLTSSIQANEVYIQNADSKYADDVPLAEYSHRLLYGSNGNLIYNSTTYLYDNVFEDVTLDTIYVSSVNAGHIYASSITFTGKVQFDRIQVKPTPQTAYWLATTGGTGNGTDASGTLWVSEDGIRWFTVDPSPDCWVGRSNTDSIQGSPHYRIATNGEYLLAYSIFASNTGNSGSNNAISYDGLTWSNIPRIAPSASIANQQATILWDGNKWWKFIARSNGTPGYENGTYTSLDGFSWTPYTWSLTDTSYTGSVWINGNAGMTVPYVANVAYNGTTMVNTTLSVASGSNGSMAFSDDLLNARSLNSGILANNEQNQVESSCIPWSDGYAWWFANQSNGTSGSLVRIYPWRSNATGISSNDPLTNNSYRYASGQGFNFTATNYSVGAGAFNGQMHVCGQAQRSAILCNTVDQTLLYSYDGLTWFRNPSVTGPRGTIRSVTYAQDKWVVAAVGNVNGLSGASNGNSGVSLWYSYDGLNWDSCVDGPFANTYSNFNSYHGGGAEQVLFMSNVKPSLDFNGIRIYNQPGGFSWHNPVSREQAINAFQSSFMLHNTLFFDTNSRSNTKLGFCNIKPQTEFDIGGVATFASQKINVSSFYVLPSSTNGILTERRLPLSTFNTFIFGSTLVSSLSAGSYDSQSGVFGLTGIFPMFRDQIGSDTTTVKNFLTQTGSSNVVMPPSIFTLSTGMTLYYRSGNVNYRQSYAGTQFFTGQHVVASLDISSAVVNTIVSTVVNDNGVLVTQLSTISKDYTGYLVSAADAGYLSVYGAGKTLTGCNAIQITEALPKVTFTSKAKDPSVFGVITNNKNQQYNPDSSYMLDSDPEWGNDLHGRIRVNSIGEGALWVTNINGPIVNGDYLCGSSIPGHAQKQDEEELYNYTVAKATISCDFNLDSTHYKCEEFTHDGQVYRRAFIGCTYHCG